MLYWSINGTAEGKLCLCERNFANADQKKRRYCALFRAQISSGRAAAVINDVILDLLAFIETIQSSLFDSADVDENVASTTIGSDETITLLGVKPFHCTSRHYLMFLID